MMKRIRIAQSIGRDWKEDLQTYLLVYCTTPNTTTGTSPSELLFKRKLRTKIPDIKHFWEDNVEVRDRDMEMKAKEKLYSDIKRSAEKSNVEIGDKLLAKQDKINKFSTPFHSKPFKVTNKKGDQVELESDAGVQYRWNVTHVNKKGPRWPWIAHLSFLGYPSRFFFPFQRRIYKNFFMTVQWK